MAGNQVKTFSCPACGGSVALHAAGHSITAVCTHCSTVIDTSNDNFRIIKKEHERTRDTDIPIGAKGILDGIKWQVIGYMEKKDISSISFWEEYLLFNPYFGFRFLVQADNHWSLVSVLKRDLPISREDNDVMLDGRKFSLFYRSQSSVEYVKGEFYWRVRRGDKDSYADFVAPPYMLSMERSKDEVNLSIGEYVQAEEVARAFNVKLQGRIGVAPNQPAPFQGTLWGMWKVAMLAVLASLLIQLNSGDEALVLGTRLHIDPAASSKALSTPVFNIPRRANVQVQSAAGLDNNWLDLDLTLSREDSNDAYETTQSIEYYSGYDEGYYWSEGSNSSRSYFSAVEPANYRLIVEPSAGLLGASGMDVAVEIRRGVSTWGNFWLVFWLVMLLPLLAGAYRWYFESRRWSNSDYAPAIYRGIESDD